VSETAPSPLVCAADGCDNTFEPNRRGRPRLYCGECGTPLETNRRWRAGKTIPVKPRPPRVKVLPCEKRCERCGETFRQTKPFEPYCGECRPDRSEPRGKTVTAVCEGCGEEFEARRRDRERGWGRWCGKACFRRHEAATRPRDDDGRFLVSQRSAGVKRALRPARCRERPPNYSSFARASTAASGLVPGRYSWTKTADSR
jgi:hypothetical protein